MEFGLYEQIINKALSSIDEESIQVEKTKQIKKKHADGTADLTAKNAFIFANDNGSARIFILAVAKSLMVGRNDIN